MLKKIEIEVKDKTAKEILDTFNEIASYREEIIEKAFKELPKRLSQYGLNEVLENMELIIALVESQAKIWDKEQEEMAELNYSYDGSNEIPGELEDRMERESEGRYLTNLYKKTGG